MAGQWTAVAPLPPTGATYTALRLTPTSNVTPVELLIAEIGVLGGSWQPLDGTGTGNNNRVLAQLCRSQSATGGTTTVNPTLNPVRGQTAAQAFHIAVSSYSVEPTYTGQVVLKQWYFNAVSGLVIQFPLGRELRRLLTFANPAPGIELMISSANSFASGQGGVAYIEWIEGST